MTPALRRIYAVVDSLADDDITRISDSDLNAWLDAVSACVSGLREGGDEDFARRMTGLMLIGVSEQERRGIDIRPGAGPGWRQ